MTLIAVSSDAPSRVALSPPIDGYCTSEPGSVLRLRGGSALLRWGDELLDAAEAGQEPEVAVTVLAQSDNQLALVNCQGRVGHTGSACPGHAGHATADNVSAQANYAVLPDAWHRMVGTYAETDGPMAERLVAALTASGGDARGRQAAAVMVTGGVPETTFLGSGLRRTSICGLTTITILFRR